MEIVACPDCDLLQQIPSLPPGGKALCPLCGETVAIEPTGSIDRVLALTITAAIVFVIANTAPLMGLSAAGRHTNTTIVGGAYQMWIHGQVVTAAIIAFCAVIAPAVYILFMLTALLAVKRPPAPQWVSEMLRWAEHMKLWSMNEVMLIGILVALIKIAELASVEPGIGMYAVGGLVVLFATIIVIFNPRELWKRVEWTDGTVPSQAGTYEQIRAEEGQRTAIARTAAQKGLVSCETCALLLRPATEVGPGHCPRCGAELVLRRHYSIQYTWALVIAAAICYIPANVLPVMTTTALGSSESDTIMSGVVYLYTSGSWPLALIVLIASVMVPLGKLVALAYLLITVQRGLPGINRERTRLYRIVVLIGRWSMLDVFVVTFTVALIQLQPLMSAQPAPGVLFFAGVVVLTMIAAESFDPRLIWDAESRSTESHG